ncbi:hypothetical protein CMI37_03810 [Candidatus Pacearchaeota archaeon]|nr:hypothetical protein [Candidatus Pacearchaeota archaeon]
METVDEMMPILELAAREAKPLIIVADNVEGQALAALIMNATRGTLRVAAIKAPKYGEERRNILKDLALSVGATFVSRENNIKFKDIKLQDFGSANTIESTKYFTTIVDGKGSLDEIEKRIDTLKAEIEQSGNLDGCTQIQERITRLASGIAIIKVGGATEIEMIEKKHRIEDALEAVKSAQQEGIIAGGGISLLRACENAEIKTDNENQQLGVAIVLEAVKEPLRQMAINAGESPDLILSEVEASSKNNGWNFATNELVNMLDAGIIDPVKVTRCALQNAASVASTLITTNYAIVSVNN